MEGGLKVLLIQDSGLWIAQALEHDICVQGRTLAEVKRRFAGTLKLELDEGNNSLEHLPPAPEFLAAKWGESSAHPDGLLAAEGVEVKLCA